MSESENEKTHELAEVQGSENEASTKGSSSTNENSGSGISVWGIGGIMVAITEAIIIVALIITLILVVVLVPSGGAPSATGPPSNAEVYEFLDRGAQIIDIRSLEAYNVDKIDGAVQVDFDSVVDEIGGKINPGYYFTQGKDRYTVIYGEESDKGVKSGEAAKLLVENGFSHVLNAWDLPTVRGQQEAKREIVKDFLDNNAVIFDTRNYQAWNSSTKEDPYPGSILLYWEDVRPSLDPDAHKLLPPTQEFVDKVPADKNSYIITYCRVQIGANCKDVVVQGVHARGERYRFTTDSKGSGWGFLEQQNCWDKP